MTLQEFLSENTISQGDFAKACNVSQQTVSRWVSGVRIPRKEHMNTIVELTESKVGPADFYG